MSTPNRVWDGIAALDELLRGKLTDPARVREGATPVRRFLPWAIALGAVHGFFIGWYAIVNGADGAVAHALGVMIKLPALFLLTLFVTFPSLYVFNALIGVGLGYRSTLRLLVATIVVNLALAASLGPILAFFTLSTTSYPFMVMLNVVLLGIAGLVSVGFLLRTLIRLQEEEFERARDQALPPSRPPIATPTSESTPPGSPHNTSPGSPPIDSREWPSPAPGAPPGVRSGAALGRLVNQREPERSYTQHHGRSGSVTAMFWIWIVTYAIVGSQMGWLLRPFVGHPDSKLTPLRPRQGSFVESLLRTTGRLVDPREDNARTRE